MSVTRRDLILEAEVITRLSAPRAGRAGKRVVYAYRTHTTGISVWLAGCLLPPQGWMTSWSCRQAGWLEDDVSDGTSRYRATATAKAARCSAREGDWGLIALTSTGRVVWGRTGCELLACLPACLIVWTREVLRLTKEWWTG